MILLDRTANDMFYLSLFKRNFVSDRKLDYNLSIKYFTFNDKMMVHSFDNTKLKTEHSSLHIILQISNKKEILN